MPTVEPRRYLFLLNRPNIQNRRLAFERARKLGLSVPAQYADAALEIVAPPDKAEALFESGLFSSYTKKTVSTPHMERMPAAQHRAARLWNERFSKESRDLKKRDAGYGVSWGSDRIPAPAPFTPVDVLELERRVAKLVAQDRKRRPSKPLYGKRRLNPDKLSTADRVWLEKEFRERFKDETLAYHLIRTLPHLSLATRKLFLDLSWLEELIKLLAELIKEDECWEMHGEISIGLVIVESSRNGGPKFTANKTDQIINEITAGLSWLVSEHPENDLSWVYDIQEVQVDVADDDNLNSINFTYDSYWVFPAMEKVQYQGNSYTGTVEDIDKYREDMRLTNFSRHSTVIFISAFGTSWHAYSTGKRAIVMAPNHPNLDGNVDTFERTGAHEMCHKFGARDEYTGNGTPCSSCGGGHGCDDIPNGNCGECAEPHVTCVMHKREFRLCQYTRGQIGWSDLFVELFTEDEFLAGTDDDVWLDIGDRTFVLDTPDVDDREAGDRNGYAIWAGGDLQREAIKRILIRKSSDSMNGGWKLRRVRVFYKGDEICDESPHQWLEDEATRFFLAEAFDDSLVNKLRIEVTTGTEFAAGTDDDVTLELAGREWNLDTTANDFENGQTNTFRLDPRTGLYVADIHTITIRKSSDGVFGGWLLKGLKLIVNGDTLYNNQSINKWLEDDDRVFTDAI